MGRTALLACPEGGTSLSAMAGLDRSSFNTEPGLRSISFSLLCFCAVCCYAGSFFVAASKKANVLALSVCSLRSHPHSPFCRCATSSPGAGEVFPQTERPWHSGKVYGQSQSVWFRQRLSLWESWHRAAMAERASPLAEMPLHDIFSCSKKEPLHAVLCNGSF